MDQYLVITSRCDSGIEPFPATDSYRQVARLSLAIYQVAMLPGMIPLLTPFYILLLLLTCASLDHSSILVSLPANHSSQRTSISLKRRNLWIVLPTTLGFSMVFYDSWSINAHQKPFESRARWPPGENWWFE